MKKGMEITAAILVVVLVGALICTGMELKKTRAQLIATELTAKMISEMANDKETELNLELATVKMEYFRQIAGKSEKTGKKWVPEWIGGGILKPIEPKDPREVQK